MQDLYIINRMFEQDDVFRQTRKPYVAPPVLQARNYDDKAMRRGALHGCMGGF